MEQSYATAEIEPLVTANYLDENKILSKSSAYKLAQKGLIPSYMTGPALTGIRFRVSEVLVALRRPTRN
jgi:hypothetical protein